jgi:hypothetical protein
MALKAKIAASMASAELSNIMIGQTQVTLQEQMAQRQQSAQEREMSLNIIIDSEGRTIDKRTGQVVQIQSRAPTIKANIKAQKRDYKTAMSGTATDLFASGTASTISGISTVTLGSSSVSAPTAAATAETEGVSEAFFDARLK